MDNKCVTCGKPIDPTWNVCPSCGIQIRKLRLCPGCNRELEENWKSCPYCEAVIVETIGPPVSIKDSVVKELHQTQQTNVHEAKGATVGGSININVGMDPNGPRSSGSPEFQYEQYLMAILQSGGSLERVRTQLDQQRLLLGLSLKQSLDIENLCLIKTNDECPPPFAIGEPEFDYIGFFNDLRQMISTEVHAPFDPDGHLWYEIPTRIKGAHFEFYFELYKWRRLGVEIHFQSSDRRWNLKMLSEVIKCQKLIVHEAKERVYVQRDWQHGWARMYLANQHIEDVENLKRWAAEKMKIFYKILQPMLQ